MSRRALFIVLFVSLALNLFLAGGIVGGLVIGARFKAMHAEGRQGAPLWAAADGLAPEHRQAYRQALRGQAGAAGQSLREARRARREAWAELAAEPFDAQKVIGDLDRARARELDARAAVERRIVDFAGALSPEERARLSQGLARSAPGPRRPAGGPRPGQ